MKSLLIVDDSEPDRYIAKRVADRSKVFDHVYTLNDGKEALHHFQNEEKNRAELGKHYPPTAVLLDVNMPKMSGLEFLEKLEKLPNRKNFDTLFIFMLTSSSNPNDAEKAKKLGNVDMYLTKPFSNDHVNLIADMLKKRTS